jgi:tyrosyl-tRNA synthetase
VPEKLALITKNLAEALNPEIIEAVLNEGRNLKVYWGMSYITSHCDPMN